MYSEKFCKIKASIWRRCVGIFFWFLTYPWHYQNGLENKMQIISILIIKPIAFLLLWYTISLLIPSPLPTFFLSLVSFFISIDLHIEWISTIIQTSNETVCMKLGHSSFMFFSTEYKMMVIIKQIMLSTGYSIPVNKCFFSLLICFVLKFTMVNFIFFLPKVNCFNILWFASH